MQYIGCVPERWDHWRMWHSPALFLFARAWCSEVCSACRLKIFLSLSREFVPKDYTQRRNERWETVFPGIGLESVPCAGFSVSRAIINHKSTETMKATFGIKNGEADVLSALLHAGPPYTLNPKDIAEPGLPDSGGDHQRHGSP